MLLEKFDTSTHEKFDADTYTQITVVDPAAEVQSASLSTAPRLPSLKGARIGFVDNSKHMALPLLKAVETILKNEFGAASFDYFKKDNASVPMPPDAMAIMARNCDAVIHGVADCGSCITWGLHDSIEFEKLGVPAVNIITTAFEVAAKARSRTLGMQGHPIVTMQHPLANRTEAEVRATASQIAGQVASGLISGR